MMLSTLLEVSGLTVECTTPDGRLVAVEGVDLTVGEGEIVGIIGESGSGKTTLTRALIGLLEPNCIVTKGTIRFADRVVFGGSTDERRGIRGREVGTVFQQSAASLNPVLTVGTQILEVLKAHLGLNRRRALPRARDLLRSMQFADPDHILSAYPHELSGGMRQRAAIALAVVTEPRLVVADECTAALDLTTQAEVVHVLERATRELGSALVFVTHDLVLAAELCTRVLVMYGGQIVESGTTSSVMERPRHPYTAALLRSIPRWEPRRQLVGIKGIPPRVTGAFTGCRFAARCPAAKESCSATDVPWTPVAEVEGYRCVFPLHVAGATSSQKE